MWESYEEEAAHQAEEKTDEGWDRGQVDLVGSFFLVPASTWPNQLVAAALPPMRFFRKKSLIKSESYTLPFPSIC